MQFYQTCPIAGYKRRLGSEIPLKNSKQSGFWMITLY